MSDEKPRGYIKLYRRQFHADDDLWGDGTPFDSRSSWTWLLQFASWKDSTYHTKFALDSLKRGEFVASLRYLAEAWGWKKDRVSRFLAMLVKARRITRQRSGQHGTVYLIDNYDSYQSGIPKGATPDATADATPGRQQRDKVEEGKEGETYSADFELLWKAYPKRHGGSNKAGAYSNYNGHLKKGVSFDIMFEGVKRYALFCIADGSVGTKYVKDCQTFLGPRKCFLDEHAIGSPPKPTGVLPISKAERDAEQFRKRGYIA